MKRFRRSICTTALLITVSGVGGIGIGSSEAATRPRAGAACNARLTGQTTSPPRVLICWPMTTASGRRVWKWLPLNANEATPSDATVRRYGGVIRDTPSTTPAPGATTAPAASGAPAGNCIEGTWRAGTDRINAFVEAASGAPGARFTAGALTYQFRGGTISGSGSMSMSPDPTGVVTGSATAVSRASYTATGTTLTVTDAATLINIDIRVNGQPIPLPITSGTATMTTPYQCTASTLTLTISIPGSGRVANYVFDRV